MTDELLKPLLTFQDNNTPYSIENGSKTFPCQTLQGPFANNYSKIVTKFEIQSGYSTHLDLLFGMNELFNAKASSMKKLRVYHLKVMTI